MKTFIYTLDEKSCQSLCEKGFRLIVIYPKTNIRVFLNDKTKTYLLTDEKIVYTDTMQFNGGEDKNKDE